jgi:hypothetical protein
MQSPLQTAVQALCELDFSRVLRMDCDHPVSLETVYARLGTETGPIIAEVRQDADFASAGTLVASFHHSPNRVEKWRVDFGNGRESGCVAARRMAGRGAQAPKKLK